MRFTRTALCNFRNFTGPLHFEWGAGLNLILGPNGAGKTNLIESLNVLSGWGPFSRHVSGVISWPDLANKKALRAQLAANISDDGAENHEIDARISSVTVLRVDGKRETSTNLRLLMPTVTFLPTDTGLIDGRPSVRRAFIDRLCALCIPVYARRLADFRKISMRRSAMLARASTGAGANANAIDFMFARLGGWIIDARRATVARLAGMTGAAINVLPALPFTFGLTPLFDGEGEKFIQDSMRQMFERERAAGRLLVGPGRMDLDIRVATGAKNWKPASEALSRGQKRRLVLALVLMAARLTENIIKRSPVLLLDDLAAELDDKGRRAACDALCATGWQVILTGVENPFPDLRDLRAKVHILPV